MEGREASRINVISICLAFSVESYVVFTCSCKKQSNKWLSLALVQLTSDMLYTADQSDDLCTVLLAFARASFLK